MQWDNLKFLTRRRYGRSVLAVVFWFAVLSLSAITGTVAQEPSTPAAKAQASENEKASENIETKNPEASSAGTSNPASPDTQSGQTFIAVRDVLSGVLTGEVPANLDVLSEMERQQQAVAQSASACTVSVQIGRSQGCGVIITGDGYVLTAAHVAMRTNKTAILTLNDGRRVRAKTLGLNREVDAGLIKIASDTDKDGQPWPHATLGTSDDLKPGVWCIAMGHPGGYDRDRGVVARVGRILAVRRGALVTDCALIGGDSGGPLFNLQGELIGIHSRIGNDVADNLHVPISHYNETWDRLAKGDAWGYLPGFRPVIGVRGRENTELAEVQSVQPGSPAETAGIQAGDIIQRFGETTITNFASLQAAVGDTMPGEQIDIRLRRGEETLRVVLEVGRDPRS